MAETHLSAVQFSGKKSKFQVWNRRVFASHATLTGRSEAGSSGGVLIAPTLRTQLAEMESGPKSSWKAKGNDWVLVIIRAKGMNYILLTAYLDHSIGPVGPNLLKLKQIVNVLLYFNLMYIIVADWNMLPSRLASTEFLRMINGEVKLVEGLDHTCISGRTLDYVVVSKHFAPAIKSVKPVFYSPWRAHVGFLVKVDKAPRSIQIRSILQPCKLVGNFKFKDRMLLPNWQDCKNQNKFVVDKQIEQSLKNVIGESISEAMGMGEKYSNWSRKGEWWYKEAIDYPEDQFEIYDKLHNKLSNGNYYGRGQMPKFETKPLQHWSDPLEAGAVTSEARKWTCVENLAIRLLRTKTFRCTARHKNTLVSNLGKLGEEIASIESITSKDKWDNLYCGHLCKQASGIGDEAIKILIKTAKHRAGVADRRHQAEVSAKVRVWAASALDGSCKAGHAYLRKADIAEQKQLAEDHTNGVIDFDPMTSVEKRKELWSSYWRRDDANIAINANTMNELRELAKQQEHRLDPIDDDQVDDAIARLRNSRGLGADWWAPKELKGLPREGKAEFADLIRECEEKVTVPIQVLFNLMALLPKPTGGERTVCLQALWHVVWSSIRGTRIKQWDAQQAQHWDSAIRGASAQSAGTMRRLLDELAVLSGQDTIGVYWDLQKFYDSIDIIKLIELSTRRGFSVAVAAIDLQVHLGLRLLKWAGSFSDPIPVSSSVLAGSKFSNIYARLYLYDLIENIHYQFPVIVGLHVDDVATIAHGNIDDCFTVITEVSKLLFKNLEERKLKISPKTVILSSKPNAAKTMATKLATEGIRCKVESHVRDLGIDAGGGGRRATTVFRARAAKAKKRMVQLKKLKRIDQRAKCLYRTNIWPTTSFAVGANGVAPTSVKKMRSNAAAAALGKFGQCTTTAIALMFPPGTDPAVKVRLEVIKQWIQLWLKADDDTKANVKRLWQKQLPKMKGDKRWSFVNGPMRATIASLYDLKWIPVQADCWLEPLPSDRMWQITGPGDLRTFCETINQKQYHKLWDEASERFDGEGLQDGVDLKIVKKHLRHFEQNGMPDRYAALATVACGAAWPRSRRHAEGMAAEASCSRCGAAVEHSTHFFWSCPMNAEIDDEDVQHSQNLIKHAEQDIHNVCFWNRGLPPLSKYPCIEPQEEVLGHSVCGDYHQFCTSTKFYLDGSGGARTKDSRLRRCGWGAIVLDFSEPSAPTAVAGCCGGLPSMPQTVPRSELYAAIFVVENCICPDKKLWLLSDCKYFVQSAAKGRDHCIYGQHADLWLRYWDACEAKDLQIRITKVKAHSSVDDVKLGQISLEDFAGNTYADKFANAGAEAVQIPDGKLTAYDNVDALTWKIQSRLAAIITAAPTKEANRAEVELMKAAKQELKAARAEATRMSSDAQNAGLEQLSDGPKKGERDPLTALHLGGQRSTEVHPSHKLGHKRGIYWCWACGKYGTSRGRSLLKSCHGAANATGKAVLSRIRRGMTPHASVEWPVPG